MDNAETTDLVGQVSDAAQSTINWLDSHWLVFFQIAFIIICAILISRLGSKIFSKILERSIRVDMYPTKVDRDRRIRTIRSISTAVISFTVWLIAFLMILDSLGINTGPLIASAGIIGVALGFGAQSLIKDFMTGMFIIAENQYRVGDFVEIQNVKGKVKAISLRTTTILDDDGTIYHIPNGSIVVTANHTMGNSTLVIDLSVSPDSDVSQAETTVNNVGKKIAESAEWKDKISEPLTFRRLQELSGGSMIVHVSGKVVSGKQLEVKSAFLSEIQKAFKKEKITLK